MTLLETIGRVGRVSNCPATLVLAISPGGPVALYWPTVLSISRKWCKDPFGSGFFGIPVALCLAWTRRAFVRETLVRRSGRPVARLAGHWRRLALGRITADIIQQLFIAYAERGNPLGWTSTNGGEQLERVL
jgi:hypothetical protein